MGVLLALVGDMRSGKTSLIVRVHELVTAEKIATCGIVEENERDERGIPITLRLLHLESGEKRLLSSRERLAGAKENQKTETPSPNPASPPPYPPFTFDPATFAWAEEILYGALRKDARCFFIDEVGPQEALTRSGFWPFIFKAAPVRDLTLAFTVRPSLTEALRLALPAEAAESLWIDVEPNNCEHQAKEVAKVLLSRCHPGFYSI